MTTPFQSVLAHLDPLHAINLVGPHDASRKQLGLLGGYQLTLEVSCKEITRKLRAKHLSSITCTRALHPLMNFVLTKLMQTDMINQTNKTNH